MAAAIGAALLLMAAEASSAVVGAEELGPEEYRPLRRELRAHHPDECHGMCKDPDFRRSWEAIRADMDAFAAAHPDYDALDIRRAAYLSMRTNVVTFVFPHSPFRFELGVNGGWTVRNNPAFHINDLCRRFYAEKGGVPPEALDRRNRRLKGRYAVVCGEFTDTGHHQPPYRRILKNGFKGIRQEVAQALQDCPADDRDGRKLLETALVGLDTIHVIADRFGIRAPWEAPQTFFEGLNSLWFIRETLGYVDSTLCNSLGHPDAWLIGLYRRDLAAGRITEAEARRLIAQFMIHADCHHDGMKKVEGYADHEMEIPVTLGGCDAEGHVVYNELTKMFLEEHQRCGLVFPKLHVRYSEESPKEYLDTIARMLLGGHAVFAMFNDAIHIPQFERLGLPLAEARQYTLMGCWDPHVDGWTDVDAANYLSTAKILENTLYRTEEMKADERLFGIDIKPIDDAKDFDEVRDVLYRNFMTFVRNEIADLVAYRTTTSLVTPYPVYSMCYEGGPSRRRDVNDCGSFVSPRVMTLAFLANVVDSLLAIRHVCFEKKAASLKEFLDAVRSNWAGESGVRLRGLAMSAPYWGDNSAESNGLERWWIDRFSKDMDEISMRTGHRFVTAMWVYREFRFWGELMRATPDGRRDGDRLAQGFSPSEYRCREGVTAVMGAISALDHTRLYASNANLTFDRTAMNVDLLTSVFRVAGHSKMHLLQPNCNSLEELLDAKAHPERHQDLMVKVCGFSARFVALSPQWQDEVISRHRLGADVAR